MSDVRINEAVAEAMDAISGDPEYAPALLLPRDAEYALVHGTTVEAADLLDRALELINEICPVQPQG